MSNKPFVAAWRGAARYTRTAIALHWIIALLICCAVPLGLYMNGLPLSPRKLQLYSYHKWLGIGILVLAVLRLLWRARHPPPPLESMARWQHIAAQSAHHALYLLLLLVPLSGWMMSSALGFPVVWFGVLPLPDLIGKNAEAGAALKIVHQVLNYALAGTVLGHSGAALWHHFIDRDRTLVRMLPFLDREKS